MSTRLTATVCLAFFASFAASAQQHSYTKGDIEEGTRQYRINCIGCHGPEGNLISGIDLGRLRFRRVSTDEEIVNAIVNGVPGTGMPASTLNPQRAYTVVAYLHDMHSGTGRQSIAAAKGDAGSGLKLFEGKGGCNGCHRVRGSGPRSGPDLSDAGLTMRPIEVETKILEPDAFFSTASQPFQGIRKDGTTVSGTLLNQDTFSFQILDSQGALRSIQKTDLKEGGIAAHSSMPAYRGKLNAQELADLLAYLVSLKGAQ